MSSDSELDNSPNSGGGYAPGHEEGGGNPAPEHDEDGYNPAPEHDEGRGYHTPEKQPSIYKRKKALLVVISYRGGDPEHVLTTLKVLEVLKNYLKECRGYNENEITVLSDADDTPEFLKPYKKNIEIKKLLVDALLRASTLVVGFIPLRMEILFERGSLHTRLS
ncbi:hypothetical protein DXG01_004782 [Tephrocybe rancida]|nr:hypothetical protein DXG01_004782 [Tephrocybe rancida]